MRLKLTWLAKLLLVFVVAYFTINPTIRRRSYYYLKRRFPSDHPFKLWLHTFKLYYNFAKVLFARTLAGSTNHIPQDDKELLTTAFAKLQPDQGVIVLTTHFGAWQIALHTLEDFGRPINIVQWVDQEDIDKHYFEYQQSKSKQTIRIINSKDSLAASLAIREALRQGEIVTICGDRATENEHLTQTVPFLGGHIRLPLTAMLFASITHTPILLTFSLLEGDTIKGVFAEILEIPQGLRHEPDKLRPYAEHLAKVLEDLVQKYPYQFFNFYNMWSLHDAN